AREEYADGWTRSVEEEVVWRETPRDSSQLPVLLHGQHQIHTAASLRERIVECLMVFHVELRRRAVNQAAYRILVGEGSDSANGGFQVILKQLNSPPLPVEERHVDPPRHRLAFLAHTLPAIPHHWPWRAVHLPTA